MNSVRMRVLMGSAALLLFAAACGGDSGDPGAGGTTDTGSMGESGATEMTGDDPGAGSLYGATKRRRRVLPEPRTRERVTRTSRSPSTTTSSIRAP